MKKIALYILVGLSFMSCNDFLDRQPLDEITPEIYFSTSDQLGSYAIGCYENNFIASTNAGGYDLGVFKVDNNTDVQVSTEGDQERWVPGILKVSDDDGDWEFEEIYKTNYFFDRVLPKWKAGEISGSEGDIQHYIGEMYMLRAKLYFDKVKTFGDFPIIRNTISLSDKEALIQANRRYPMNEVGRFILSDLDSAAVLMESPAPDDTKRNRLTRNAALLLKSRVALYEATWLKYFKGTPFVPNGEGWPGKKKDYNANYEYPTGSIDGEIDYFLEVSMEAAKEIAEKYKGGLTENTGVLQQSVDEPKNPYFEMFANQDLSAYPEAMLWRLYGRNLVTHETDIMANAGNDRIGVTRGLVNNFLMADGTPVYRNGSYADGNGYYMGDKTIHNVRQNRDSRLSIFLKEPGQINILYEDPVGTDAQMVEPYPQITTIESQRGNLTGYLLRKGASFDQGNYLNMNCFSFKSVMSR